MPDDVTVPHLGRVLVVGTSCCGKTTFARELAATLGATRIELDELYWGPGWNPKPESEFLRLTEIAIAGPRWVVDGNYRAVRDLLWPRATSVIWLNFGFATVFGRAFRRTIRRCVSREVLYSGNRESLARAFFSRESILLWVLQTYWQRRRDYPKLQNSGCFPGIRWFELRRPAEAAAFLHDVARAG
jgi:adenylate kinase family enzyme